MKFSDKLAELFNSAPFKVEALYIFRMDISAMQFPSVWIEIIQGYLQQMTVVLPDIVHILPTNAAHTGSPLAFLLPPVLFWSPMEAYGCSITCPKCVSAIQVNLEPHSWSLGANNS